MASANVADRVAELLPATYDFQIEKTIEFVQKSSPKRLALQLPEGLLVYSTAIAEILAQFAGVEVLIMGDVAYGGCCVDDLTARALGCGAMVHYGHSALVPSALCAIPVLYVPVDIDLAEAQDHLQAIIRANFGHEDRLALVSTVQFRSMIAKVASALSDHFGQAPTTPAALPLNPGETLGCTAPPHGEADNIICVGDGRFHMESVLMSAKDVKAYRFDPYTRALTREYFDHTRLAKRRSEIMTAAANAIDKGGAVGIVFGSLGRQGNPAILKRLETALSAAEIEHVVVVLAEVDVEVLESFSNIAVWVEIACPRLALDWGADFATPLITPYEAFSLLPRITHAQAKRTATGDSPSPSSASEIPPIVFRAESYSHPMDNYSGRGGPWANYYRVPAQPGEGNE